MNISIVIPVYEEAEALETLLPALRKEFPREQGFIHVGQHQILVIWDGKDDGVTALCVQNNCEALQGSGTGLGDAILLGIRSTIYDYVIVMDGDGQHPISAVRHMAEDMVNGADFVAGRRTAAPGLSLTRRVMSWGCSLLAKPLSPLSDPMTGLFGFDKLADPRMKNLPNISGWKVALELSTIMRMRQFMEVDYVFEERWAGKSHAGLAPALSFLKQLGHLYARKINFTQMAKFCAVGTTGLILNLAVLTALVEWLSLDYRPSAILSIGVAMLWNYFWNKFWTFRRDNDGRTGEPAGNWHSRSRRSEDF